MLVACESDEKYCKLEDLYFCPDCVAVRCVDCVDTEAVCIFCPCCLFEVASSTAKAENGHCGRNCTRCPICQSYLSVKEDGTNSNAKYKLICNYCYWDSTTLNLCFDRPTGISQQIKAFTKDRADILEFQALDRYYSSLSKYYRQKNEIPKPKKGAPKTTFVESVKPVFKSPNATMSLKAIAQEQTEKPTILQSFAQLTVGGQSNTLSEFHPLRVPLRFKRKRKCKKCGSLIVNPDIKASSNQFLMNSTAWSKIPHVDVVSCKMVDGVLSFNLEIINPTENHLSVVVMLYSQDLEYKSSKELQLGPYDKDWKVLDFRMLYSFSIPFEDRFVGGFPLQLEVTAPYISKISYKLPVHGI